MSYADLVRLAEAHPWVQWFEPIPVTVGNETRFCCRVCIGLEGLKGAEIDERGFATPNDCLKHIGTEHIGVVFD